MFRSELEQNLKSIFGFRKVSFDAPGDAYEQDTLFVEIQNCHSRTTHGRAYARVTGSLVSFSQQSKLPYVFFNRRIGLSDASLVKQFFFFDMDRDIATSPARLVNIVERRCGFVFLYQAQYNPPRAAIESVEISNPFRLETGQGDVIDSGDGRPIEVMR